MSVLQRIPRTLCLPALSFMLTSCMASPSEVVNYDEIIKVAIVSMIAIPSLLIFVLRKRNNNSKLDKPIKKTTNNRQSTRIKRGNNKGEQRRTASTSAISTCVQSSSDTIELPKEYRQGMTASPKNNPQTNNKNPNHQAAPPPSMPPYGLATLSEEKSASPAVSPMADRRQPQPIARGNTVKYSIDAVIALIHQEIDQAIAQGDTAQELRQRIKERLKAKYPQDLVQCRTYDFSLVKEVDGKNWFFLSFFAHRPETAKDTGGLLFVSPGITHSAKVVDYFDGGTPCQTISRVLAPAQIKLNLAGQPIEAVKKGQIETSGRQA